MPQSETRAARRAKAAERARQRKKGQRAYTRKELIKEREAATVAKLFCIVERKIPASQSAFERAQLALDQRIRTLQERDPALTWEAAVAQLRASAGVRSNG